MKHKTKSLLKLAAAALLFFAVAPLHAVESVQKMGFTEAGKGLPLIPSKDLLPDAASGRAVEFSLDLYFGKNTESVSGIMPMIHYNSDKMEILGISNIAPVGFIAPNPLGNPDYTSEPPLVALTIGGKLVASDADRVMLLSWMSMNRIDAVADATLDTMVRVATIAFRWKAGATGNSHIGITQNTSGTAHEFKAKSITVQGPPDAEITATPASIDVTAGETRFSVTCTLSRTFSTETTCDLARPRNAKALASTITPAIDGAAIVIPSGETSGTLAFRIRPSASDRGRTLGIVLRAAIAGGVSLARDTEPVEIALMAPGLMVSQARIDVVEGGKPEKFSVKLATRPANAHVVVNVASDDTSEAALAPPSLTFTAANWDTPQHVTVRGVADKLVDGDKDYKIRLAVDTGKTGATRYHDITASVSGKTIDNDEAKPVLRVEPQKLFAEGSRRVVVTAALEDGVVSESDTKVGLSKNGGSAKQGTHYEAFTLPESIIIPAGAASAATTFMLTIRSEGIDENATTIDIGGEFFESPGASIAIPGITLVIGSVDLDVDSKNGVTGQDGIMIARYVLGVRDEALTAGQSDTSPAKVAAHIEKCMGVLNVSGDKKVDHNDGFLFARYLLGLRGEPLVRNLDVPDDPKIVEKRIADLLR